jgi:hypothetical protein
MTPEIPAIVPRGVVQGLPPGRCPSGGTQGSDAVAAGSLTVAGPRQGGAPAPAKRLVPFRTKPVNRETSLNPARPGGAGAELSAKTSIPNTSIRRGTVARLAGPGDGAAKTSVQRGAGGRAAADLVRSYGLPGDA